MIPRADIAAWRAVAPWSGDPQVEQDLVLSRAIVELFSEPAISQALAFRGGTALHKVIFSPPGRYSEDIDLVQIQSGPIGPALNAVRGVLDSWLGAPSWKLGHGRATLNYRFDTTSSPTQRMRLKLEINTREQFTLLGHQQRLMSVDNPWFSGNVNVTTYEIEELLGTKLRALYQRKKGRDLYDLWMALAGHDIDDEKLIRCFSEYMGHGGHSVSRAQFEANLAGKLDMVAFGNDIAPLLAPGSVFDSPEAAKLVHQRLVSKLPGEKWKGCPEWMLPRK